MYLVITGGCDEGPREFQLHPRVRGCCLCASAAWQVAGGRPAWRSPRPAPAAQLPLATETPDHRPLRHTLPRTTRWTALASSLSASAADTATGRIRAGRSWAWRTCAAPLATSRPDTPRQTGRRWGRGCRAETGERKGRTPSEPAASQRTWHRPCRCSQTQLKSLKPARTRKWRKEK